MELDIIKVSDCLSYLATLPDDSINCVVTSPPYFGLRDYEADGQIGSEATPQEFIQAMLAVGNEIRRVLHPDGVFWLNIGDSYAADRGGTHYPPETAAGGKMRGRGKRYQPNRDAKAIGYKHKDLMLIPQRIAIALQDSGWYVRAEMPWLKINPMPENAQDRPAKAHEYVFMLTKRDTYYFDASVVKRPPLDGSETEYRSRIRKDKAYAAKSPYKDNFPNKFDPAGRNYRSTDPLYDALIDQANRLEETARQLRVIAMGPEQGGAVVIDDEIVAFVTKTEPTKHKHTAPFPMALIEPMILASCPPGGVVLDPFMGSGTTALVARKLGRHYIGCDLNPNYVAIALDRLRKPFESRKVQGDSIDELPLFSHGAGTNE